MFTAISGASFVDNTNKARSQSTGANAGTFLLFQGPTATNDEAYFGMSSKFDRIKFKFGTAGVQNTAITLAWEYWNGSAWAAVSGLSDGTSELTADGSVTWTIPGGWVTKSVNSVTQYWLRLTFTAGTWTTNPLAQYTSVTGWTQVYGPTSNQVDYQTGGGNQVFYDINDNGPGAGTGKEARILGFETLSALATGTGQFPASVLSFIRKSTTADATTRAWVALADDRTVILFFVTGDNTVNYNGYTFGDFYSLVTNDAYRNMIIANNTENSSSSSNGMGAPGAFPTAQAGKYIDRAYHGVGAAISIGTHADSKAQSGSSFIGAMQYPHGPDGGLWLSPIWVHEALYSTVRGRLRGVLSGCHAASHFVDGDTISGSGDYAGKTFMVFKLIHSGTGSYSTVFFLETSNTWETN